MSDNQYNYEFKESKVDVKSGKDSSAPPSYEEATGANSEVPTVVEFPEPRLIFPEPDFSVSPPETHAINISDIPVKTSSSGTTSHEALLNKDPNLLYNFFLYYNTAPKLFVDIKGYHTEYTTNSHRVTKPDGEDEWETREDEEEVIDFEINLDASQYISPSGILHLTNPEAHSNEEDYSINSINQLFEKYTQSKNHLKEIQLEKVIQWDFEELTRAILYSIRSQGYQDKVNISYRRENYKVNVISESKVAKLYHSKIMSALCFLTCCCVIFWPIAHLYKDKLGENFRSTFKMSISTQEWYYQNISSILSEVRNRSGFRRGLIRSEHGSSTNYYSSI
ncbi:hypothetical protein CONCODRAFT_68274 [Conidiobolus coronatus NRRL 28638]|uniref:Uncharacterized protein n=1 Tax=Conidiobolus coronatus (strain ATCC 28846 / CBS 209.66 / NRRL 28638) TaxID=796925 RepID=A0A137PEQ4_CONC2|nr:hypothetical protein CONCODRAFT_68274 [Conidiobolus coronatus NRRL 28638]|eukprot:KXN73488.1 hypothetical protein CONCODRAFT_68274 [Conidiobolus coronatus NRRL 28638]